MMTLRELSERTKLSVSLLSEIERGVAQPSMASLKKISHAMGFGLFDFAEENHRPEGTARDSSDLVPAGRTYISDVKVVRANQRKQVMDPTHSPFVYELLTPISTASSKCSFFAGSRGSHRGRTPSSILPARSSFSS